MNQVLFKENQEKTSKKQLLGKNLRNDGQISFDSMNKSLFENEVNYESSLGTINEYSDRLNVEEKLVRTFEQQIQSKIYIFDKILPFKIRNPSMEEKSKVNYFIPSELFLIFSPHFLNGIGHYLEDHEQFSQERKKYQQFGSLQGNKMNSGVIQKIQPFSDREEEFITSFLLKHSQDEMIKEFLESILRFYYFYIAEMAQDQMIRSHTEPSLRSKYTSIYEFYHNGNEEMKKYLISKIFGKESLNTRYHQFIETSNIFITYCVKYENNYVALLRMIRLNEIEYSKKLKNERLVNDLKQKGYQEIFYVYTLYVLPLYKRKGHGKHILSVLKNEKVPFVLCSSATAELSGVPDNVGSGYFYRKCGLEEYFPLSVQQEDELDHGCLNQSSEHKNCDIKHCINPLKAYPDESYYVYCP